MQKTLEWEYQEQNFTFFIARLYIKLNLATWNCSAIWIEKEAGIPGLAEDTHDWEAVSSNLSTAV